MMMYIDADPSVFDNTPLDQRLDNELKTIRPAIMGIDNPNQYIILCLKYRLRNPRALPLETKRSIVSEASDFIKYYESMQNKDPIYMNKVDESLDDFVVYLKGLKSRFLEDLVLKKIAMVEDEFKQKELLESYPQRQ